LEFIGEQMKSLNEIYNSINSSSTKIFLTLQNESVTYKQLQSNIEHLGGLYAEFNVEDKQRIVICSSQESFVINAVLAAFFNGICCTVLATDTPVSQVKSTIEQIKPALVLLDSKQQSAWQLAGNFSIYQVCGNEKKASPLMKRFFKKSQTSWQETILQFPSQQPYLPDDLDSDCFIVFTSGTTSSPKGVQLTYRNLLCHLETLQTVFSYSPQSKLLNNMMLTHVDGLFQGPLLAIYNTCSLFRPCSMEAQHIEAFLNTIYSQHITHLITVPTVLGFIDRFAQYQDYFDNDHFCHLISVAGMLDTNVWIRLEERFAIRINNIYGLTETVAGGLFCGPSDDSFCHATIGKPVDLSIRIVDKNNSVCAVNEQGELWLKGSSVFTGYFDNFEATNSAFEQDWFKTGDIASQDDQGFVKICGRLKELIISGGVNVHPGEVNEAILRHQHVAEVATLGLPDPHWQEIIVSVVVLIAQDSVDAKTLISHCRQWLEPKKTPRRIYFVKRLPKGDAGKVNIPKLTQQLQAYDSEEIDSSSIINEKILLNIAANTFNIDHSLLSMQSKAGETPGWDSLGHLTLVLEVEKATNTTLTTQQIMSIQSLEDILSFSNANNKASSNG